MATGGNVGNLEGNIVIGTKSVDDAIRAIGKMERTLGTSFNKLGAVLTKLDNTLKNLPRSITQAVNATAKLTASQNAATSSAIKTNQYLNKSTENYQKVSGRAKELGVDLGMLGLRHKKLTDSIEKNGIASESARKNEKNYRDELSRVTKEIRAKEQALKSGGSGGGGPTKPPDLGGGEEDITDEMQDQFQLAQTILGILRNTAAVDKERQSELANINNAYNMMAGTIDSINKRTVQQLSSEGNLFLIAEKRAKMEQKEMRDQIALVQRARREMNKDFEGRAKPFIEEIEAKEKAEKEKAAIEEKAALARKKIAEKAERDKVKATEKIQKDNEKKQEGIRKRILNEEKKAAKGIGEALQAPLKAIEKMDKANAKRITTLNSIDVQFKKAKATIQDSTQSEQEKLDAINELTTAYTELVEVLGNADSTFTQTAQAQNKFKNSVQGIDSEEATRSVSRLDMALRDFTKSTQVALGPLSGVASRIAAASALIKAGALPMATLILSVAGLAVGIKMLTARYAAFEQASARVNRVLQVTGKNAQASLQDILNITQRVAEATGQSSLELQEVSASALTLGSISPDNLERALQAAIGIGKTFGGDLLGNVKDVAEFLEANENSVTSLNEKLVFLNKEEQRRVLILGQSFRLAEAQEILFKKLGTLMSVANTGQKTLLSTVTKVKNETALLVEKIGESTGITGGLIAGLDSIAEIIKDIANDAQLVRTISEGIKSVLDAVGASLQFVSKYFDEIVLAVQVLATLFGASLIARGIGLLGSAAITLAKNFKGVKKVWETVSATMAKKTGAETLKKIATGAATAEDAMNALGATTKLAALGFTAFAAYDLVKAFNLKQGSKEAEEFEADVKDVADLIKALPTEASFKYKIEVEGMSKTARVAQINLDFFKKQQRELQEILKPNATILDPVKVDELKAQLAAVTAQIEDAEAALAEIPARLKEINKEANLDINRGKEVQNFIDGYTQATETLLPFGASAKKASFDLEKFNAQVEQLRNPANAKLAQDAAAQAGFKNVDELINSLGALRSASQYTFGQASKELGDFTRRLNTDLVFAFDNLDRSIKNTGKLDLLANLNIAEVREELNGLSFEKLGKTLSDLGAKGKTYKDRLADAANIIKTQRDLTENINTLTGIQADYYGMSIIPGLRNTKDRVYEISKEYDQQLTFLNQMKDTLTAMPAAQAMKLGIDKDSFIENINTTIASVDIAKLDALSIPVNFGQNAIDDFNALTSKIQNSADPAIQTTLGSSTNALMTSSNETKLAIDQAYYDQAAIIRDTYFSQDYQAYLDHMKNLDSARLSALQATENVQELSFSGQLQASSGFFGDIASVMEAGLGKQHTLYKRFAQAQILLSGADAVMSAFAMGTKLGGPIGGMAFAAAASAVVGAQLAMVDSSNFANGGAIRGAGTSKSDSIPINASNGEFMMQAKAVRKFGVPFMNAINAGRVPAFATGGAIGGGGGSVGASSGTIVEVYDQRKSGEQVSVNEETDADGIRRVQVMIRDTVNRGLYEGHFDGAMTNNYGQRRRGMR